MKQLISTAIILRRTDFGEADRILTLLTPDYGKLRLLAKGVRRVKSKMAGGIELFSVSEIGFMKGRGEIGTLLSTRLIRHYGRIVGDLERTMQGYECIKQLHKATEDELEAAYFELLHDIFKALNDLALPLEIVRFWFDTQLLRLAGHTPNLQTDDRSQKLVAAASYAFNFEQMAFTFQPDGPFQATHIKFLRLAFAGTAPAMLSKIRDSIELLQTLAPLVRTMRNTYIRV